MILLVITSAQAKHIAQCVQDPALIDQVCQQLRFDEIFVDVEDEPRTMLFRDYGDGLRVQAVSYNNDKAADAAEDRFWQRVLAEEVALPLLARDPQ